jgi:hypothetical protein
MACSLIHWPVPSDPGLTGSIYDDLLFEEQGSSHYDYRYTYFDYTYGRFH